MIRKSVMLAIAFAVLALPQLCHAQTQEFNIDSMIEVMRAGMQADRATIISMGMNFNEKDGAAFWRFIGSTSTNDPGWTTAA